MPNCGKGVPNSITVKFATVGHSGVLSFSRGPRPKSELWFFEMRSYLIEKCPNRKNEDIGDGLGDSPDVVLVLNLVSKLRLTD